MKLWLRAGCVRLDRETKVWWIALLPGSLGISYCPYCGAQMPWKPAPWWPGWRVTSG